MAGGAFFVSAASDEEDRAAHGSHAVQWVGSAKVRGPKWGRLPLLTIGMLGIQCVWSIEMGYASPFLLELGLPKSRMSLVFMAGPLSGLIVQPLVGVFADRSRSRWGRRRPYMIAGCLICAFAMMLLGWARTVSGWLGGGDGLAIAFAVFAIFLVDFSINAVMSTDRALVVDTLPPAQQEEGSAWGGRMFGFGSVLGFFVGNLDLTNVLSFLGDTQIKILSFITSGTLLLTHSLTSWAVSERVLLRDDRPNSRSGFYTNIRAIWDNMFALPPGIQSVCFVQFFNFLAWFPILFFTSIWVSEIYAASVPSDGIDPAVFKADAVRAGNRALFLQALVTITVGIIAPFLVAESGVQAAANADSGSVSGAYEAVGTDEDEQPPLRTPLRKFAMARSRSGLMSAAREAVQSAQQGKLIALPIKGFTLVKLWAGSMALFSFAMACTWFTSTVGGAYFVISLTGVGWALTNWAPYSLLGELILIDGQIDRSGSMPLGAVNTAHDDARRFSLGDDDSPPHSPVPIRTLARHKQLQSSSSRSSIELKVTHTVDAYSPGSPGSSGRLPSRARLPTPLRLNLRTEDEDEHEDSIVIHHPDDDPAMSPPPYARSPTTMSPVNARSGSAASSAGAGSGGAGVGAGAGGDGRSTAEKAGILLGIHNVYVVLPQFVVTAMASFIFWLMEPDASRGLPGSHPHAGPVGNTTAGVELGHGPMDEATGLAAANGAASVARWVLKRAEAEVMEGSSDAVGLVFRIGGVSAAVGAVICWRMARRWERGEGI